jgi:hypothetical protein
MPHSTMKKLLIISVIISAFYSNPSNAQISKEVNEEAVKTLDNIISTLYTTVSGNKTQERNWELFRYLCHKDAKLIYFSKTKSGEDIIRYMTQDEYISSASEHFSNSDFFEREIHRTVNTFGPITQVFSTYESLKSEKADTPFTRGINSIQLLNDGKRWWLINIYWTGESETNPIPKQYLPKT